MYHAITGVVVEVAVNDEQQRPQVQTIETDVAFGCSLKYRAIAHSSDGTASGAPYTVSVPPLGTNIAPSEYPVDILWMSFSIT